MEKFIPYEKLSKKEKRRMDLAKRQTWGELNPVTRKPENSKAYNRNKARNWKREARTNPGYFCICISLNSIQKSFCLHLKGREIFFGQGQYTGLESFGIQRYTTSHATNQFHRHNFQQGT